MVQIIETTINMKDHQSRVIKYSSWEEYCQLYDNYDGNSTEFINGTLLGVSLPNQAMITQLKYDDFHLECFIKLYDDTWCKRFAYLINDNQFSIKGV